jgi:hypothetical protein
MKKSILLFLMIILSQVVNTGCHKDDVAKGLSVLTTDSIANITPVSAACFATIISESDSTVTLRGFCWNTSPMPIFSPTYNDFFTAYSSDSIVTGTYTSYLTPLFPSTTYYVRAFVTGVGHQISYGNQLSFTTPSGEPTIRSFTPISDTAGGRIIINGTFLSTATFITIGGVISPSLDLYNDTTIIAQVPKNSSGVIMLTNSFGTAISANSFTFIP